MARLWRAPATRIGLVGWSVVLAGVVNGLLLMVFGPISPGVFLAGFGCSFVGAMLFLSTFPPDPADRRRTAAQANRRGMAEYVSFARSGRLAHLNLAVKLLTFARDTAPPDDPAGGTYTSNLASTLAARYERTGQIGDLDAAIATDRLAVAMFPDRSAERGAALSDLVCSYIARFGRTGDPGDLDAAIEAGGTAVDLIPEGHPSHALALSNLGGALAGRYERAGDPADADAAVRICERAVRAFPADSPHRGIALSNLSVALKDRSRRTGRTADLDAAVETGRAGVAATPAQHPNRPRHLFNLGTALALRHAHNGQLPDLDAAIEHCARAIEAAPPHHPDRVMMLSAFALVLRDRYARTGRPEDIDASVAAARDAVDLVPEGHPHRASCLSNLGLALADRFDRADSLADLDAAITAGEAAVDAAPEDDPDRGMYLSNLAGALLARFTRTGTPADLDTVIALARQAVETTPAAHGDEAGYLNNLGYALISRFELNGDAADLDAATGFQREAARAPAGRPTIRLKAAREWGELAVRAKDFGGAVDGFGTAVDLLPRVAWHGLDRTTQEDQLAGWQGLAADAAAVAVAAGQPERAVELLEQGRSVLWTQALHLRDDLTRLAEQAPDLCAELKQVGDALDPPAGSGRHGAVTPGPATAGRASADRASAGRVPGQGPAGPDIDERHRLARRWDDLVARARAVPGFAHLFRPVPFTELRAAATDGPVVIVNASRYGCHALLVTSAPPAGPSAGRPVGPSSGASAGVRVLDLPDVTADVVASKATELRELLARETGPGAAGRTPPECEADRHALLDLLEWLWDSTAAPILDALGHTGAPGDGPPSRLWWCPTGPFTALPLHAAGRHTRVDDRPTPPADLVAGRVVSSYTPSLGALRRAREARADRPIRQLVVGVADAPGHEPLPAVRDEVAALARHLPPPELATYLTGADADRATVLAAIPGHSWLHLACHARQHVTDPSRSSFTLWDGELTVADLTRLRVAGAELAFLSACQTATGAARLADEAVHLAAAMLLLGYGQVIATLWTVHDDLAPLVADRVYTQLLAAETEAETGPVPALGPVPGARALHRAVEAVRVLHPADPLLWAPYLHTGA